MIPPRDEAEARAKALSNARELVDKLDRQSAELAADPRYADGAALARSALDAARNVRRILEQHEAITPSPENSK